jgi:hypothetical protein
MALKFPDDFFDTMKDRRERIKYRATLEGDSSPYEASIVAQ